MVWEMPRSCRYRIGLPALRAITDREGRLVSRCNGQTGVTVEASDPIGSPEKPLTNAQLEAKLRDCARNAVQPLSDVNLDGLLAAIGRLETLPDARELMTAFAG